MNLLTKKTLCLTLLLSSAYMFGGDNDQRPAEQSSSAPVFQTLAISSNPQYPVAVFLEDTNPERLALKKALMEKSYVTAYQYYADVAAGTFQNGQNVPQFFSAKWNAQGNFLGIAFNLTAALKDAIERQ